ncbi:prolyl-tRNA synthetase [Candidatus Kinetoplastibacterium oncopeltii TCC290E]|uniref:Proline--tRNA ligase n=1 Tax=Candidatus Kinetoplastidibacterium stringomonadis TCC290E TaxID=1208920 RepID=M1LWX0_9PROT|nr:proline--tRNA ligase [Candidatus Kinetoplastibacterium oncopeltii]AGF48566.1 prolyl-tRNA synthetase [Candidatus Kinetoplastibacterium oncopeltii TCC290E]
MHATKYHIFTLKEAPSEAEIISHKLMIRSGMIRKISGGIYTHMPLGLRVLRKIESIVREEMNRSGSIELLMPVVQPAELWQKSGRIKEYGPELLRFKDRNGRDFVIQPTSEEVISEIVKNEIHSYKQMPLIFYHIQTKFRDEIRPRFGLIRSREFIMKDAYSFDTNEENALISYETMFNTYSRIFNKIGLEFRAVTADTGSIGGNRSHEFHVIAETGEDTIVYDKYSTYAANTELAEAPCLILERGLPRQKMELAQTIDINTCNKLSDHLKVPIQKTVKSIIITTDSENKQIYLLLIRGDHTLNDIKVKKIKGLDKFRLATEQEILDSFNCKPGFLGPVNVNKSIIIIADKTVANMSDFICGANIENMHYIGVNWYRDLKEPDIICDIRNVSIGDKSPDGKNLLSFQKGIEVGHVFFLGTKYSTALNVSFLNKEGKSTITQMGCYGIGITRIMGAAIEQNNDDNGIIWPRSISPFEIVICPIGYTSKNKVQETAIKMYELIKKSNIDVILDDREKRPGIMFAEWDLIGIPLQIVITEDNIKNEMVEIKIRKTNQKIKISMTNLIETTKNILNNL